jgi:hypothetical protein
MHIVKNKQRLIGTLVLICSYSYIIYRLSQYNIVDDFRSLNLNQGLFLLISTQIGLSTINLVTESIKWRVLLKPIQYITTSTSFKMVLSGFSSGIFTPGKIGEPIGRIVFLPHKIWAKASVLNYFGGFLQNIVIASFGIVIIAYFSFIGITEFQNILIYSIVALVLIFTLFLSIWLFKNYFRRLINYFKWKEDLKSLLNELTNIGLSKLATILGLSLLRYFIYSCQLILFFAFFYSSSLTINTILLVPVYFFCITMVPSFLLADLGIRNSVALLLFSSTCLNQSGIILSVSILWVLNQAIPALIGSYFMLKTGR